MIKLIYLVLFHLELFNCKKGTGPIFIVEPPLRVDFVNDQGAILNCIVHGDPEPIVRWKNKENYVIDSDLIRILPNNSLSFLPFESHLYKQSVHASDYICEAQNIFGIIVSRTVHLTTVIEQHYSTQVYDEYVMEGNTAILKCRIPSYMKEYVDVFAWFKNDEQIVSKEISTNTRKYALGDNGNLYVFQTSFKDAEHTFRCKTFNGVAKTFHVTDKGGKLHIKIPTSSVASRINENIVEIKSKAGSVVNIPCIAQGSPKPRYRWCFKKKHSDTCQQISTEDEILTVSASEDNSGNYVCEAFNEIGTAKSTTKLTVYAPLSVFIHPQVQLVDIGQAVTLKCVVSGDPISRLRWLHNGKVIKETKDVDERSALTLNIKAMNESTNGMFQCFIINELEAKQASGQITLSALPPKIIKYFGSNTVRPTSRAILECIAIGEPLPTINWYLRERLIEKTSRTNIKSLESNGKVKSSLIIEDILKSDGGLYRCEAQNKVSKVYNENFLNVYGSPKVWPLGNITVLSGERAWIQCHISGYPIKRIDWYRDGKLLKNSQKVKIHGNGSLVLQDVKRYTHSGQYKCVAVNNEDFQSSGTGYLSIIEKPKLLQLKSETVVEIGGRFQLTCSATKGDPPIKFAWTMNGKSVPHNLNMLITSSVYSSTITSSEVTRIHAGNYTCMAKNSAGIDQTSSILFVEGSPEWEKKPFAVFPVEVGQRVILNCTGKGYPLPITTWVKKYNDITKEVDNSNDKNYIRFLNGTFIFNNVQLEDTTFTYVCSISNGIAPDLSQEVKLIIQEPKIIFTSVQNSLEVKMFETSVLQCKAKGRGPFSVQWSTGSKVMMDDGKRIRIETSSTINNIDSSLTIKYSRKSDAGLYKCKIKSENLQNSTGVYLQIKGASIEENDNFNDRIDNNLDPKEKLSNSRNNYNETGINSTIFNESLLYIIPTTTAAVVLFVILIIVCILLQSQRRRNKASSRQFISNSRNSTLNKANRQMNDQYNYPKAADDMYYKMQVNRDMNGDEHVYSSMSTYPRNPKGNIQPYATFTSESARKYSEPSTTVQYELQRFQ